MGVGAKCQRNAGECKGIKGERWVCVQRARECRGMSEERMGVGAKWQGGARGPYGTGCKVPGEPMGMQGNPTGTYGGGCKMPGDPMGMQGNAKGTYGSGCIARGMQGDARMPG